MTELYTKVDIRNTGTPQTNTQSRSGTRNLWSSHLVLVILSLSTKRGRFREKELVMLVAWEQKFMKTNHG